MALLDLESDQLKLSALPTGAPLREQVIQELHECFSLFLPLLGIKWRNKSSANTTVWFVQSWVVIWLFGSSQGKVLSLEGIDAPYISKKKCSSYSIAWQLTIVGKRWQRRSQVLEDFGSTHSNGESGKIGVWSEEYTDNEEKIYDVGVNNKFGIICDPHFSLESLTC